MKLKDVIRSVQQDLPITMRMDKWLSDNPNPVYSDEAIEFSRKVFTKEVGGQRQRRMPIRSSAMGMCQRRRVFSALGVDEAKEIDAKLGNIFGTGNFLHLKWQMAGLTEGWLSEAEIPVELDHMKLGGTLDGRLDNGDGFEFKTIHSMGYGRIMTYGPKTDHVLQVHSYMYMDPTITAFSIVYEDKNTGEWREYRVERDEKIIKDVDREVGALNVALDTRKLPKVLNDYETKEGATYRQCPFKDVCLKVKKWPTVVKGQVVGL